MKTVLNVTGMTCGGCVKHVSEALRALPGVTQVEVTLRDGSAAIEHDARGNAEAFVAAVREQGYEASER